MSLIERELTQLKESSEEFFDNYIKSFQPKMNQTAFNKFRLHFINLITDKLSEFYPSSQQQQFVIHTLQIAFQVWDLIPNETEHKDKLFYLFFMGTCFLCTKFDSPELKVKLKNWACENNIDIQFSFWAEKLIFQKTLGDLYLSSPYEVIDEILSLIIPKDENNNQNENKDSSLTICETYKNFIDTWIQFALYEYDIYSHFNLYTITLACIDITIAEITPQIPQEQEEKIKHLYKQIVVKNSKFFDTDKIKECKTEILKLFYSEEEKEDEEENLSVISSFSLETAISNTGNSYYENIFTLCSGNISGNYIEFPITEQEFFFKTDEKDVIRDNVFLNKKRKHNFTDHSEKYSTLLSG